MGFPAPRINQNGDLHASVLIPLIDPDIMVLSVTAGGEFATTIITVLPFEG